MKLFNLILSLIFAAAAGFSAYAQNGVALEEPVLVSSAGQSADVTLGGMLLKKAGVQYTVNATATKDDLGDIKTLVIVPGYSTKGLGAAGVSREEEYQRVEDLINAAESKNIKILMMHIGGNARRGEQSDSFNKLAAESSVYMLVVKQGDEDNFFSDIASARNIPIELEDKMAKLVTPVKNLFNK